MFVLIFFLWGRGLVWSCVGKRPLRRADYSSQGVLPSVEIRGSQTVGPAFWRTVLVLWGARVVCMRGIFILNEIWAQDKIYFGKHFAWLKYFTYRLVPVLAPNYKQHILSPAKVIKSMLFISWIVCKMCLFEFIRVERARSSWNTLRVSSSYKRLGTSGLNKLRNLTCMDWSNSFRGLDTH
jgi:hypothetical protein